jgi:dienelactone hydrolase
VKHPFGVLWVVLALSAAEAAERVTFPGPGLELAGELHLPDGKGPFPAIVMLHGCSGLADRRGLTTASYNFWAEHFRQRGFVALLVDSFGPRGERDICNQAVRRISESADRPRDAYAALDWLSKRDDVDPKRIHLIGWSNGGTTVLHALLPDAPGRAGVEASFRSAVAFYPGCRPLVRRGYRPTAPLLIQAGAADNWTPADYCERLVRDTKAQGAEVEIDVYENAHHSFDRLEGRVRFRPDVRNVHRASGRGATAGPHPEARAKAIERTTAFIEARNK